MGTRWNNLTRKAGLYILDPVTNIPQYGTHYLRRYFISNFGDDQEAKYFARKAAQNDEAYHMGLLIPCPSFY